MERPLAMTTERPACGLASLLSMSCRDRAEAFARSLQVRLQTLGLGHAGHAPDHAATAVAPAAPSPSPPSPAVAAKDRARPPLRLGSSSDSDLYYDFDLDPESPGSPAEDAVELVVAHQPLPANSTAVEPESGCTSSHFGTSPGSDSSDSFGPEAFVSPSSSPGWSAALALAQRRRSPPVLAASCTCNGSATILNGDAHEDDHDGDEDCFTRLESGLRNNIPNGNAHLLESELNSLHNGFHLMESPVLTKKINVQESNDTKKYVKCLPTTNSSLSEDHDEVTKSCDEHNAINNDSRNGLENESIAVNITNEDEIELLPETSKSDYCRSENEECNGMSFFNSDDWDDRFSDYTPGETFEEGAEAAQVKNCQTAASLQKQENTQCSGLCSESTSLECPAEILNGNAYLSGEIQCARAEMGVLPRRPSWENQGNDVRGKNALIINQEDNLEDHTQIQEVVTNCESFHKTQDVGETVPSPCLPEPEGVSVAKESFEDKTELSTEDKPKSKEEEEDGEENDDDEESPKQRLRRCSSLKTGKTPPGTPSRKKIVRFADALGLDLADVRTFLDEIPKIPSSAYDDLQGADLSLGSLANPIVATAFSVVSGPDPEMAISLSLMQPCKTLMPMFQQPGGQSDFLERIRTKFVSLENAVVKDSAMFSIGGVVRVRNLAFDKSVYIRYTIDNWTTYSDLQATYVPNSCDGFSDKFSFVLFAHTLAVGQRIEFAVRFQCGGSQYWDSNGGANYAFQCLPACNPTPYMSLPSPDDRWSSFY